MAQLIDEHKIPDATEKGSYHYFENLQLVVAAINPADYGVYNTEPLDIAELNRFRQVQIDPNKASTLRYLKSYYDKQMQLDLEEEDTEEYNADAGRKQLAITILGSPIFEFDDSESIADAAEAQHSILSPRSFTRALNLCDGTKDDLLDIWNSMCNPNKKGMVSDILSNYQDIDNKANSVFKNPFKSVGSENWKKITAALNTL